MENTPLKVLYVEDEQDIQTITAMALETFGHFVLKVCNSGKEALDHIDEFNPDFVVTDVMMPEMDGPTLLQNLRNHPKYKTIPVIFTTAKAQVHEVDQYMKLGATRVLSKPFDLINLSTDLLNIWELHNKQ